jgi:hypothetical protein
MAEKSAVENQSELKTQWYLSEPQTRSFRPMERMLAAIYIRSCKTEEYRVQRRRECLIVASPPLAWLPPKHSFLRQNTVRLRATIQNRARFKARPRRLTEIGNVIRIATEGEPKRICVARCLGYEVRTQSGQISAHARRGCSCHCPCRGILSRRFHHFRNELLTVSQLLVGTGSNTAGSGCVAMASLKAGQRTKAPGPYSCG